MSAPATPGLFELRFYTAQAGRRDDLAEYMDRIVIPFNLDHGVDVLVSFVDETNENIYIWIRRFDDEADRDAKYEAVYQDVRWTNEIAPVVHELMQRDGAVVSRALPTAGSRLR